MKKTKSIVLVFVLLVVLVFIPFPFGYAWELERPDDFISIEEREENATTDGKASLSLGVHIHEYYENSGMLDYRDGLGLRIVATANSRKILEYGWAEGYYYWYGEPWLPNQLFLGDDQAAPIPMPIKVRFYGGPGSAEYTHVWVTSNGWLSFYDPEHPNLPSPSPYNTKSIPDTSAPNNFVAPFWRDLIPTASGYVEIRYGKVGYWPGFGYTVNCFAISWEARDITGNTQIFQVLMEEAPSWFPLGNHPYRQSRIWFQYKSVTKTDSTTIGVEDQGGWRGAAYNYQDLHNEMNLEFGDLYHYARIKYLTIKLSQNDPTALTDIVYDANWTRGWNIKLEREEPDTTGPNAYRFLKAFAGTAVLLLGPGTLVGLLIRGTLVILSWADFAAGMLSPAKMSDLIMNDTYTKVPAYEPTYNTYPVDAILGIKAFWLFTDPNNQNHTLTLTSELTYEELNAQGQPVGSPKTISTSVKLKMYFDDNDSPATADLVVSNKLYSRLYLGAVYDNKDYYNISAVSGQELTVTVYPPSDATFYLYLYSPTGIQKDKSEVDVPGVDQVVTVVADSTGLWTCLVKQHSGRGFYKLVPDVHWPSPPGGCPTLFVWNGSEFIDEGVLNIHSEPDIDVIINHTLTTTPASQYFMYTLKLAEIAYGYNYSHSYIDQVKLYTIDNNNVTHQTYLLYANHSRYGNVLWQLLFSDDLRTDTLKNDEITLKFLASPWIKDPKTFIFQIEGHNPLKE